MRAVAFVLVSLILVIGSSNIQSQISIKAMESKSNLILDDHLSSYEIVTIEREKSFSYQQDQVNIFLNTPTLGKLKIIGTKNDVISDSSVLSLLGPEGRLLYPNTQVRSFEGTVDGSSKFLVFLTIGNSYLLIDIFKGKEHYILESVSSFEHNGLEEDYVIYEQSDLINPTNHLCKRQNIKSSFESKKNDQIGNENSKSLQCKEVDLLLAVDYSLFVEQSKNIENIVGLVASVINLVNYNFSDISSGVTNYQINFRITELSISSCADCDYWTTSANISHLLNNFIDWTESTAAIDYDLAGLFTATDFQNSVVGLANVDRLCKTSSNFIISVQNNNTNVNRAITSHEIGHVFGCQHNYTFGSSCDGNSGRNALIMDPIVYASSTAWSDGTYPCAQNSLEIISNTINIVDCISDCGASVCYPVANLKVDDYSTQNLSFSWSGSGSSYWVIVKNQATGSYLVDEIVENTTYSFDGFLNSCAPYTIKVQSICNGLSSTMQTVFLPANNQFKIELIAANIMQCAAEHYDLEISLIHQGGNSSGFKIDVDGVKSHFNFMGTAGSIQKVNIYDLIAYGSNDVLIKVYALANSSDECSSMMWFNIPNSNCDIIEVEKFDFCCLPSQWTKTTTNSFSLTTAFEWNFANEKRPILNYAIGANENSSLTLDDSCMAYFDDDIDLNPQFTGNISLQSKIFDFSTHTDLNVSFSYNFHNFENAKGSENNSSFSFEVFDGYSWAELYFDDNDYCPFYDVWDSSCSEEINLDISNYNNPHLRVRFNYTDGNSGDWTGMIAVDNFEISASRRAILPIDITNFEGRVNDSKINLAWETKAESLMQKFVIERFNKETSEYDFIGEVYANSSSSNKTYNLIDENPVSGDNLYRLNLVSSDNGIIASILTSVNYINPTLDLLIAYPNPLLENHLVIKYLGESEIYRITIFTINGIEVKDIPIYKIDESVNVNLQELGVGSYIVQLETDNNVYNHKIVKL